MIPPSIYFPGALLPCIAGVTQLKTLIPGEDIANFISTLTLTYAPAASDISIAALILQLPNLETINLKGCILAGTKTVDGIVKRCPKIKKVNLKGTKVSEDDVGAVLNKYGRKLEVLKVDNVAFRVRRSHPPDGTIMPSTGSGHYLRLRAVQIHYPSLSTWRLRQLPNGRLPCPCSAIWADDRLSQPSTRVRRSPYRLAQIPVHLPIGDSPISTRSPASGQD